MKTFKYSKCLRLNKQSVNNIMINRPVIITVFPSTLPKSIEKCKNHHEDIKLIVIRLA